MRRRVTTKQQQEEEDAVVVAADATDVKPQVEEPLAEETSAAEPAAAEPAAEEPAAEESSEDELEEDEDAEADGATHQVRKRGSGMIVKVEGDNITSMRIRVPSHKRRGGFDTRVVHTMIICVVGTITLAFTWGLSVVIAATSICRR
jgi:hypothetical protein